MVLDWFQSIYGFGRVVSNRTAYDWLIRGRKDTDRILKLSEPYLRVKTKQARLARQILVSKVNSKNELVNVALMADTLSKLNVRSKNRRSNYAAMIQETISRND
jgi:hypothetical protein